MVAFYKVKGHTNYAMTTFQEEDAKLVLILLTSTIYKDQMKYIGAKGHKLTNDVRS